MMLMNGDNNSLTTMTAKLMGILLTLIPRFCSSEEFIFTSDQPGILGSSVTFYTRLENVIHDQYTIAWQENYPNSRAWTTTLTNETQYTSNWTLLYTRAPGNFSLTVIVTYSYVFFEHMVAQLLYKYEIKENFTGTVEINQPGVPRKDPSYVSTLNETELTLLVHDPANYLQTALNVTYTWSVNNTVVASTMQPTIWMNFTEDSVYPLQVNLMAAFNSSGTLEYKYGSFRQDINAKVPIRNFSIQGATWFRHGKLLDLTITCDGSPPYEYCWILKIGPYNHTGNETCQPAVTTECSIHISRYFESGTYNLLILLNNDVGEVFNQTGIHVYKTTTKPQLSIIIVPISCTLIAIVLIIFGVAYYWENQVRYKVEVADFDFGQNDEAPYIRFLDRLRDAVASSMTLRGRRGSLLLPPDNDSAIVST